jgi:hypothetical protein
VSASGKALAKADNSTGKSGHSPRLKQPVTLYWEVLRSQLKPPQSTSVLPLFVTEQASLHSFDREATAIVSGVFA